MEKITYGAPRYMDWVAQIKAGSATVRVHFTGGALTVYGVTPAEYTTSNPFVQKVIEQSQYFKEGRIVKLRSAQIADNRPAPKPKKAAPKPPTPATEPKEEAEETANSEQERVVEDTPEAETPASETIETSEEAEANGLTEVEVNCLQDAQDYLQQNFGISSYKVRSKVSAQKAAAEHGVMFTGPGFNPAGEEVAETAEE